MAGGGGISFLSSGHYVIVIYIIIYYRIYRVSSVHRPSSWTVRNFDIFLFFWTEPTATNIITTDTRRLYAMSPRVNYKFINLRVWDDLQYCSTYYNIATAVCLYTRAYTFPCSRGRSRHTSWFLCKYLY